MSSSVLSCGLEDEERLRAEAHARVDDGVENHNGPNAVLLPVLYGEGVLALGDGGVGVHKDGVVVSCGPDGCLAEAADHDAVQVEDHVGVVVGGPRESTVYVDRRAIELNRCGEGDIRVAARIDTELCSRADALNKCKTTNIQRVVTVELWKDRLPRSSRLGVPGGQCEP